jgi:hypothetical protein
MIGELVFDPAARAWTHGGTGGVPSIIATTGWADAVRSWEAVQGKQSDYCGPLFCYAFYVAGAVSFGIATGVVVGWAWAQGGVRLHLQDFPDVAHASVERQALSAQAEPITRKRRGSAGVRRRERRKAATDLKIA